MHVPEDDPFDTAGLRRRVLDAWAASPARFREDANAEEDLALGGYRDRVVVELAQNAADAAARAGVPGRLLLRCADGRCWPPPTPAPRWTPPASSRCRPCGPRPSGTARDRRPVRGRLRGRARGQRRARGRSHRRWCPLGRRGPRCVAEVAAAGRRAEPPRRPRPGAAAAVAATRAPATGYDTVVLLPLRDAAADDLVRCLLAEVDDALLLALPALAEVVVEVDGDRRVVVADADAVAGRAPVRRATTPRCSPTARPRSAPARWWLAWALPLAGQPVARVVHAPTPTDEPLGVPALLIASFPLDPTRRHVAPGPLTDFLVQRAADAYAELATGSRRPARPAPVAGPGRRAGRRAARGDRRGPARSPFLRRRRRSRLRRATPRRARRGRRPVARLAEALGPLVADHPALERLGTRRLPLADVVDRWPT